MSKLRRIHHQIDEMGIENYTELVDLFMDDDDTLDFIANHSEHFVAYFENRFYYFEEGFEDGE